VRPFSKSLRRAPPPVSINVRRKPPLIARRGNHHCALLQLGVYSGTSIHMVRMFERMGHVAKLYGRTEQVDTIAVIRAALEAAGIEFTTGRMPGARLREPAGIE